MMTAPELYDGVLWRRTLAFFIDLFLLGFVYLAIGFLAMLATALTFGALAPVQAALMALLPSIYAAMTIHWFGATPGMRAMNLSVRDWRGRSCGLAQGFLMAVVFYASFGLTSGLIMLVPLFSDRRRAAHDMLAATVVVRAAHVPAAGRPA
ncbi:RDD family protein [Rhodovibrio salinarum]|nr:RDD family protein [Rhodovibrio salinarum]